MTVDVDASRQVRDFLDGEDLLRPGGDGGMVRAPLLLRGRLVAPPPVSSDDARAALESRAGYGRVASSPGRAGFQVLRQPLVDRQTMRTRRDDRVLVLPDVAADSLLPDDPGATRAALARIPFATARDWFEDAAELLRPDGPLGSRLRDLVAATSNLPDLLLDAALATNAAMLRGAAVAEVVDRELAHGGIPGTRFLDEWVPTDAPTYDGPSASARDGLRASHGDGVLESPVPSVRAFPTLQIHITAGNAPVVAPTSAMRALATRSGSVVKLPSGAVLPGIALGLALRYAAGRGHAVADLLEVTSLAYWRGGDSRIEDRLFDPRVFDRVVVWGAPDAVERIGTLAAAGAIKTLTFMPRYGVSLIGRELFADARTLGAGVRLAAADTIIWNQQACIASLVHYVEGGAEEGDRYAAALRDALQDYDRLAPCAPAPDALGRIRRLRRGKLIHAAWSTVGPSTDPRAAVVHVPGSFELADHPFARVVMVRTVADLQEAVDRFLHRAVSTVGIFPESRRLALRDRVAAQGVSNVLPLGGCERAYAGMPHDGMRVLSELVEWANA